MKTEDALLGQFLEGRLALDLGISSDARAYVLGVLTDVRREEGDLSKQSLVVAYRDAIDTGDFVVFQRIGDYVLWVECFAPESLRERELAQSIGRLSYQTCWRLVGGSWTLFEELADRLPDIGERVRSAIRAR